MSELSQWVENQAPNLVPFLSTEYAASTGSTNDDARRFYQGGGRGPRLYVVGEQSAGRGRLGRRWESAPGKGLYFSLLCHPRVKSVDAPLIPLAVGLALKAGLKKWDLPQLVVKWPNDLWLGKKKLGGVLSELFAEGAQADAVVVGVGVNLSHAPEDFPEELRKSAISLAGALPSPVEASALLQQFVPGIFSELQRLAEGGAEDLLPRWERESGMVGARVEVREDGANYFGTALGLEKSGALRVQPESGAVRSLVAGDVFLV